MMAYMYALLHVVTCGCVEYSFDNNLKSYLQDLKKSISYTDSIKVFFYCCALQRKFFRQSVLYWKVWSDKKVQEGRNILIR